MSIRDEQVGKILIFATSPTIPPINIHLFGFAPYHGQGEIPCTSKSVSPLWRVPLNHPTFIELVNSYVDGSIVSLELIEHVSNHNINVHLLVRNAISKGG
ncbi:hypothetical protein KP509_03G003100 [Ceratopteris richardii]|uniref:Uncharacterized protein n=1 Tax=Ceratopteris richardii TaxID=49495 RepID=A0A8T2V4I6_CERRI|nr:hypothetical protein KP509_03G003100 [Ceratopteris richardii]